jgi:acyl carrier protein
VLNESDVYPRLAEIFAEAFMRGDLRLSPDLTAADVDGWDSLKQILIISAVEERFGIRMTTREMDSLRCVGDLVQIIVARGS